MDFTTAVKLFNDAIGDQNHGLYQAAVLDLVLTVGTWMASFLVGNTSLYDPYWSVWPPIGTFLWLLSEKNFDNDGYWRKILVTAIVLVWAIRLTVSWIFRLGGELFQLFISGGTKKKTNWRFKYGIPALFDAGEDWRYRDISKWFGGRDTPQYWILGSFLLLHLFPTIVVYIAMIPIYLALTSTAALNEWDYVGLSLSVWGIWLEYSADLDMDAFLAETKGSKEVCRRGLWKWSRHPNYVGEQAFWIGFALSAYGACGPTYTWIFLCPLVIVLLFVFASLPMMETRQKQRRGKAWDEYVQETALLIPLTFWRLLPILSEI